MTQGRKTGGRKKGVPNKVNLQREKEIAASGLTPMEYLLSVLRNPKVHIDRRMEAARAVAPYCHPKLSSVTLKTPPGEPLEFKDASPEAELIGAYYKRLARRQTAATSGSPPRADPDPDSGVGEGGQGTDRSGRRQAPV